MEFVACAAAARFSNGVRRRRRWARVYIIIMSERAELKCSSARFPSTQQECSLLEGEGNGWKKSQSGSRVVEERSDESEPDTYATEQGH